MASIEETDWVSLLQGDGSYEVEWLGETQREAKDFINQKVIDALGLDLPKL